MIEDLEVKLRDEIARKNAMIECYKLQEREYINFIEGLELEIQSLKKGNAKLKDELEEILKSKNELRKLYQK